MLVSALPLALGLSLPVCLRWAPPSEIGELDRSLPEASGLAVSAAHPGRLYHLNDSGDGGSFYISGPEGRDARRVDVEGFDPEDAEDLGYGPCPGSEASGSRRCLYLADVGDNDRERAGIQVAVVEERDVFPSSVAPLKILAFHYPDRPHGAEGFAVGPDGSLFILTKEKASNPRPARLFRAAPGSETLARAAAIDIPAWMGGSAPWEKAVTGLSLSPDGSRFLALTYGDAVEFAADLSWHRVIPLRRLPQQEAIAYLPDGISFLYSSERGPANLRAPLMRVGCQQAGWSGGGLSGP